MKALAIRATLLGIAIWLVLAGRQCFGAWQRPIQHEFWQSSAPDCSAKTEGSTWHLPSGQVRTCQLHHGKNLATWRWEPPQEKLIERPSDAQTGCWWVYSPEIDAWVKICPPEPSAPKKKAGVALVRNPFPSKLGTATAEGIVARPIETLFDKRMERVIIKLKTKDFMAGKR